MKFYIKQKIFSLRDKFKIMDASQKEVFQIEGKMISIQNKLQLLKMDGSQILNSKRKVVSLFSKYFIFDPHGEKVAEITRKFSMRPKFVVTVGHNEYQVEGSLFAHSFGIFDGNMELASIQKKVISWGDTYEIDIHDELNTNLFLFIVIIIDQVIHEKKQR